MAINLGPQHVQSIPQPLTTHRIPCHPCLPASCSLSWLQSSLYQKFVIPLVIRKAGTHNTTYNPLYVLLVYRYILVRNARSLSLSLSLCSFFYKHVEKGRHSFLCGPMYGGKSKVMDILRLTHKFKMLSSFSFFLCNYFSSCFSKLHTF